MSTKKSKHSFNSFQGEFQGKDSENIDKLTEYVQKSDYIDVLEQPSVCRRFNLPYLVGVFRKEYSKRFYNYVRENTTTVATVSKATGIPHKYLCEVKALYQKKGLLKVLFLGKCPTTGSNNVQYVSTNSSNWNTENTSTIPQYHHNSQLKMLLV